MMWKVRLKMTALLKTKKGSHIDFLFIYSEWILGFRFIGQCDIQANHKAGN